MAAADRSYRVTRLPFGWRYSPSICQRLVSGIVRGALRGPHGEFETYLDDVLIAEDSKGKAKRAARATTRRLTKAKFIISKKLDLAPKTSQLFVGKVIDSHKHAMHNLEATLTAAPKGWLLAAVRGYTDTKQPLGAALVGNAAAGRRRPLSLRSLQSPQQRGGTGFPCLGH